MARRYAAGATLDAIGKDFGLTRERVRQLILKGGYRMSELKAAAAVARRRRITQNSRAEIRRMLLGGLPLNAVVAALHVPIAIVREIDATDPAYARTRKASRKKTSSVKYTDEEVLECLRAASERLGGVLTTTGYDRFTRGQSFADGRNLPTHQTAFLRFGSWRAALDAAGLSSNPSTPIAGSRIFSEGNCIDAILEVERALGHLPSVAEYETYAKRLAGAVPSAGTIRHRFGRWPHALRRAVDFASSYSDDSADPW